MRNDMGASQFRGSIDGHCRQPGFTLIELMAVLVVAGVILAFAVPSFTNVVISNELIGTANTLVGSLNQARLSAIKRNGDAQFCSNSANANSGDTLGTACGTQGGAAYAVNGDGSVEQIHDALNLSSSISLGNGSNGGVAITAIRYGGEGLGETPTGTGPYTGLVADVFSNRISTDNHRCVYIITGSVISTCAATNSCPSSEPASCQ